MVFIPPERLIKALKNAGYSQKQIADMAGTSDTQISHILSGDRGVSLNLYMSLYALWEKMIKEVKNGV